MCYFLIVKHILTNRNTRLEYSDTNTIDTIEVRNLIDEASRNRVAVLDGALSVENFLTKMISHFFFGQKDDKKTVFDEMVMNSDWCSFAAKRKLFNHIVNKQNLLQGSDKESFDGALRKVMSLRNAFAHGKFSSDGKTVWLNYFEGNPRQEELTDQYLSEVERNLNSAWHLCLQLALKTGAVATVV